MEWRDQGILLSVRRHGESSAIIDVFTESQGKHSGIVRGGASRKMGPMLQVGAQLDVVWRARLQDHMGSFTPELIRSRAGLVLDSRIALAGLSTVCALLGFSLGEREVYCALYRRTIATLDLLEDKDLWPLAYLRWELALLEDLGFGLDLSTCAVTGQTDNLMYVSPKSGRAVSKQGAGDWADRLLPLPEVLLQKGDASDAEIILALQTTGHFLTHHLAPQLGQKPVPEARARLLTALSRNL